MFHFHFYFIFQVRRTKISERIKKLQELVPNMDTVLFTSLNDTLNWLSFLQFSNPSTFLLSANQHCRHVRSGHQLHQRSPRTSSGILVSSERLPVIFPHRTLLIFDDADTFREPVKLYLFIWQAEARSSVSLRSRNRKSM